jgi:hypothetical protein
VTGLPRRLLVTVAMVGVCSLAAQAASPEAASPDGRWRVSGDGATVLVRDGGRVVKSLPARSLGGQEDAAVSIVQHLAARRSFVIAFDGLAELWELSVDPAAAPVFDGLVHDFRSGEGLASPGFLGVRRTRLEAPVRVPLAFDARRGYVLARAAEDAPNGNARLTLLQLDIRREVAHWAVAGDPDLAGARAVQRNGRPLIELPDSRRAGATIRVDLRAATLTYGD